MELTNQQLSNDVLKSIFDAAFVTNELTENILILRDDINFFIDWNNKQNRLTAATMFPIKNSASKEQCFEFCQRVNTDFSFIRAYIQAEEDGVLWINFVQDLPVFDEQSINAKTIVLFTRQFQKLVIRCWKKAWGRVMQNG